MQADEIDKKSISLLGVKEESVRPTSPGNNNNISNAQNHISVHINAPSTAPQQY